MCGGHLGACIPLFLGDFGDVWGDRGSLPGEKPKEVVRQTIQNSFK